MAKTKLFKHQQEILKKFPHKAALIWSTGTGKTLTAIKLAEKSETYAPLFICPKGLKKNWNEEITKHYKGHFLLLTKEEFRRDWQDLKKHNAIVVDEAHNFFGMTSDMSKALGSYIKKHEPEYVWFLSATPYRSSPWDIYKMAELLGRKMSYWAFRDRFFTDVRFGNRRPVPVVRKGIERDVAELVSELGSVVKLEDCVDVPEQTFEVEYFELTDEQKAAMLKVYDVQPIVRYTKFHQICGGSLKSDGYMPDEFYNSYKLNRLVDLVLDNQKVIIVCRYTLEVDMIAKMLMMKTDREAIAVITGSVDDRHEVLQKLRESDKYVLIVSAAIAEGWELADCPLMVFYSYDFSLVKYIQMLGRIQRINNIKKNTYLSLVVKDTIDEAIYQKVAVEKMEFNLQIYSNGY